MPEALHPVMICTVSMALHQARMRLAATGVDRPDLDARILLAKASGVPRERFYGKEDGTISTDQLAVFRSLVARRCRGEPVSRIVGTREFWSLELAIDASTLDPRPDSETLVEAVLEHFPERRFPLRALDLGTGSGCLLLAILSEYRQAQGLGIDIDAGCLAMARQNAAMHGLAARARFALGDWADGCHETFDMVLCNPPYVPAAAIASLAPEVACYDPRRALDGGGDGLNCYRRLVSGLPQALNGNGMAFLEIGAGQADAVRAILESAGLIGRGSRRDLGGHERCLIASRQEPAREIRQPGLERRENSTML